MRLLLPRRHARCTRGAAQQEETGFGSGTVIATSAAHGLLRIQMILNPQWPTCAASIVIG